MFLVALAPAGALSAIVMTVIGADAAASAVGKTDGLITELTFATGPKSVDVFKSAVQIKLSNPSGKEFVGIASSPVQTPKDAVVREL
jgi:hypothetical protein